MYLSKISIKDFRMFSDAVEVSFSKGLNFQEEESQKTIFILCFANPRRSLQKVFLSQAYFQI